MTQASIRGPRVDPHEIEELLQQVFNSDAYHADPLVKKLVMALEDYGFREKEGALDEPAWKKRELELKDAFEVVVRERDAMCNLAFGAAIDRLDEGLAILELQNGPDSAAEFTGPWAWRDFAVGRMRTLRDQFRDGVGEAEVNARIAIRTKMPPPQQPVAMRPIVMSTGKRKRMGVQMKNAQKVLVEAANKGRRLSITELEDELLKTGADRGRVKKIPGELMDRGLIKIDRDGLLAWIEPT